MQVQLLAKDRLNFLLDLVKLHGPRKHQDPTRKEEKKRKKCVWGGNHADRQIMSDLYQL